MWTYRPQNRWVGSDFAFRYIFRLRSCRLLAGFIMPVLPPLSNESSLAAGSLPSPMVLLPPDTGGTTDPSAVLSPSVHFPFFGYRTYLAPPISQWDEEDFSSCN